MQSLPPNRSCDDKIVLMEGTNPICVRPYRYHVFQKNKFKGLVTEMTKFFRWLPNFQPFSFGYLNFDLNKKGYQALIYSQRQVTPKIMAEIS